MLPSSHPAPINGKHPVRARVLAETNAPRAHFGLDAETFFLRSELAASHADFQASQAERDQLRSRLASAQTALATLAHEIKNPLASLELHTELLAADPACVAENLCRLRAGLRGLHATVNNVLSFHTGAEISLQPLTLSRPVVEAVEFARPLVDQAGLDLHVQGSSLPGQVQGNAEGIRQLLLNLIANAVRHTAAPGAIRIGIAKAGTNLRLTVRDTGAGIAPEHLPYIFRAGWSGAGSTGLGLAVSQRIAAQHGSVLQVQSTPGEGATFSLELTAL